MAAEVLSDAGCAVTVADRMPSPARKFLMAGKSGLNLTNRGAGFAAGYGDMAPAFAAAITAFGPDDVMRWAEGLGQPVFTGSTGRVFPVAMKASPLLRAWLARLSARGVALERRWHWQGWARGAQFETPRGPHEVAADITVLAMGGASWRRLGTDGGWAEAFEGDVAPFQAANAGIAVDWSAPMARWSGTPVKGVALHAGAQVSRGEWVVSARGIEGGGVYAISRAVRQGAPLTLDLAPDLSTAEIAARLARQDAKASLATLLRKALKLDGVRAALLHEFARPLDRDTLAATLKALPVAHAGLRPMDEAISTAGGLRFDALDGFRLRQRPDTYAAGEMLDWEAPTGGWLLTGCLATGRAAALQALVER